MTLIHSVVIHVFFLINMMMYIASSVMAYRATLCSTTVKSHAAITTLLRLSNTNRVVWPSYSAATNVFQYSTSSDSVNSSHNNQNIIRGDTTSSSSSSTSHIINNNMVILNPALSPSSIIGKVYETLDISSLCDATCVMVQSPTPDQFNFYDNNYLTSIGNIFNNNEHHQNILADNALYKEIEFGKVKEQNNRARLNKFMGGRIALRRAFEQLNTDLKLPIFKDQWGAPILPSTLTGSISHKDYVAVGVAALDDSGRIGVDLEHCNNKASFMLQRRILTANEREDLGKVPSVSAEEDVLLRFSFKEAIYKAIHSYIPRSIDFTEVEVYPNADGGAKINFLLKTNEMFDFKAVWYRYREKYWLTCVHVTNKR